VKRCRRCGTLRPLDRFAPRRATCRECINADARAKGRSTYTSDRQRLYEYGMTRDEFDARVTQQAGRCPICEASPAMLVVDHDHRTGMVRGLLCGPCNRALGHLQDRPDLCRAAAGYLR
jgi:hypothetical protein